MRRFLLACFLACLGGWIAARPDEEPVGLELVGNRNDAALDALSRLLGELAALRSELHELPPNLQNALLKQGDEVLDRFRAFYNDIATNPNAAALLTIYRRHETALREFTRAVQERAGGVVRLQRAVDRVSADANHLETRLLQLGGTEIRWDDRKAAIVHLAETFGNQADALARLAAADPTAYPGLEGLCRALSRSAARLADRAGRASAIDELKADHAAVRRDWASVAEATRRPARTTSTEFRLQSARLEETAELLEQQFLAAPLPPPPPVPPVPPQQPAVQLPLPGMLPAAEPNRFCQTLVVGADAGGGPNVRVFFDRTGQPGFNFFAYDPRFGGGVRVALADVTGDGFADIITAPGPGHPPVVKVFDGRTARLTAQFFAYDPQFVGGVFVAAAQNVVDGRAILVTGADAGGGPNVRVFDAATGRLQHDFFAYPAEFPGGVRVAAGDVTGDGFAEIITAPGPGMPPIVHVFDGRGLVPVTSFPAFEGQFLGGVNVAVADRLGPDRRGEILIGADAGGGPHVRIFDGATGILRAEFFPYDRRFLGGVRVAAWDVTGDGQAELVTTPGPGMPPLVRVFRGRDGQRVGEFFAFDPNFFGGVFAATR